MAFRLIDQSAVSMHTVSKYVSSPQESASVRSKLVAMGCPKLNIAVRTSNEKVLSFYRKEGYSTDDVISLGKRLISDV